MLTPFYDAHGITLYCGDSLELLPMLAVEKVSFVYSDPPYGINVVDTSGVLAGRDNQKGFVGGGDAYKIPFGGVKNRPEPTGTVGSGKPFGSKQVGTVVSANGYANGKRMVECGNYAAIVGDDTTETAIGSVTLCLQQWNKAVQVWWGGNYYADALPPSSCWIVWDKQNTGNFADAELAWTNQKTAVRIFKHMWNGLLKASERGESRIHPTQKPVRLCEWVLRKYGKPNDLVLDPFSGSGSALVAARRLNRKAIGVEISPAYCELIVKRLESENLTFDLDTEQSPVQPLMLNPMTLTAQANQVAVGMGVFEFGETADGN